MSPDHKPTLIEQGTDVRLNYPLTLTKVAIACGPGMGSMVRFTPPPCGRATRVVVKVEGSPKRLHTGLGSGAPRTPRFKPQPRISRRPSIVKLYVSKPKPPLLTCALLMVKLSAGPLYQH